MTPTPEQLELVAFLMRNPDVKWEWRWGGDAQWNSQVSYQPWMPLFDHNEIRIHPSHQPKPEPTWSINKTVPTLLIYADADGATKFGAIQKQDEERIWFFNFAKAYILDKSTGGVTALDPEQGTL